MLLSTKGLIRSSRRRCWFVDVLTRTNVGRTIESNEAQLVTLVAKTWYRRGRTYARDTEAKKHRSMKTTGSQPTGAGLRAGTRSAPCSHRFCVLGRSEGLLPKSFDVTLS
jgi:hypothetical protein